MCSPRMRARVPTAAAVIVGYVRQRKLAFHKRSDDGSAKANAFYTSFPDDRVWGVVYRMCPHEKPLLDQCEFLGIGYDQEMVDVVHKSGTAQAWIYVARPEAIDATLFPYAWYHDLIVHGARQHGLPAAYVDHLRRSNIQAFALCNRDLTYDGSFGTR